MINNVGKHLRAQNARAEELSTSEKDYLDTDLAKAQASYGSPFEDDYDGVHPIELVRPRTIQNIDLEDDDPLSPLRDRPVFETKKRSPKQEDLHQVLSSNLVAYDNLLKKSPFSPDRQVRIMTVPDSASSHEIPYFGQDPITLESSQKARPMLTPLNHKHYLVLDTTNVSCQVSYFISECASKRQTK